jgi:hypothetical protein
VAGLPASALIGIRHALERGRGGEPVATALLGTVMAVAALCATAVFGASLTHLVSSPALYGAPFQVYFAPDGGATSQSVVTGPLLDGLRRDHAITQVTLADEAQIDVNGSHVRTLAVTPVRGAALVSAVDGRQPSGDREIMLGAATMRATGARLGEFVQVTITDPAGVPHKARFRVIGRASLNAGTGGLGNGAVMTIGALLSGQCPPGRSQSACQRAARQSMPLWCWSAPLQGRPDVRRWPGTSASIRASPTSQASRPRWSTSANRSTSRCCSGWPCRYSASRR